MSRLEETSAASSHHSSDRIRIVIADDQTLFRDGLRVLVALEPQLEVAGEAADGTQAQKVVRATQADILLLNQSLLGADAASWMHYLHFDALPAKTIVLTDFNHPREMIEALARGARGVAVKRCTIQQLKEAIRCVHAGGIWVDPAFVGIDNLGSTSGDLSDLVQARRLWNRLTAREREIASLFAGGHRCCDIAVRLAIREGTVRSHLHRVYIKLRISNRRQLAVSELYSKLQTADRDTVLDRVA